MAKIGLDIGHGKNTFPPSKGVYRNGKGYAEYDANSRVGRVLKAKLESAGHTVVMAQPFNGNDVPLATRTNNYFANGVDLIISLHSNASGNKNANGYAAFYWHNDSKAKKLADLYEDELIKQGFKLWGGSRPSRPNDWSNFHMCRVPSQRGVPSMLVENGFFTNNGDFEWIFGSKKVEFAEKCATAAFNTIQRFLGISIKQLETKPKQTANLYRVRKSWADNKSQIGAFSELDNAKTMAKENAGYKVYDENGKLEYSPSGKTTSTLKPKEKIISQMVDEILANKHGNGHTNRRKSLGISQTEYDKVRAEVNRRANITTAKPKPKKTLSQMAAEVMNGKHGNGHENRRKSLGISKDEYSKVSAEVNKRLGHKTNAPSKSISQMATEVIKGKHGSGHANRQKSLGINKSEYEKVRAEVNRRL